MRQVFKKVSVRQKIGVSTPRPPRLSCVVNSESNDSSLRKARGVAALLKRALGEPHKIRVIALIFRDRHQK